MVKRLRLQLWALTVVAVAAIAGVGSFFIFEAMDMRTPIINAILVTQAIVSAGALPFYLRARHHFRGEFRRVQILLGVGVGLVGFAQLQTLLVVLTNFLFWVDSGLIGLAFLVAIILIFWSMRQFARELHLKTHWTSLGPVGLVTFGVAVAAGFVPFLPGAIGDAYSPVYAFSAWSATVAFLAAILVGHIARTISGIYSVALSRLNVALLLLAFISFQYLIFGPFFPPDSWVFTYGVAIIAFVPTSLAFLWTGLAFNFIGEESPERIDSEQPTSLNIITYVASLASDQDAIDDILDGVRQISATLPPGQVPDSQLQHHLAAIYLQLEEYLTTKETVQNFTSTTLRKRIETTLGLGTSDTRTFWPLVTGQAFDQPQSA